MYQTKEVTLRDDVLQGMTKYAQILRELGMDEQAEAMESKIAEYAQGMFQVMFTGPFSAGKSTVLNALNRRRLLKTSIKPETAVLAKIVNGPNSEMVTVTFRDLDRPDIVIPYEQFKTEFRLDEKDSDKFKEIAYVTVTNEMRNQTVAFVDSPGLDHTETDNEISNTFADKADAIVMVLAATKLGSAVERDYIQKRFAGRGLHNVFFVVNWYNALKSEDVEEFPEHLKNLIGCVFTDAAGNFNQELYDQRVFPVDAYTSECARTGSPKEEHKGIKFVKTSVSPEEDEYTGVPDFEKALTEFLDSPEKEKEAFNIYLPQAARYYASAKHLIDDLTAKNQLSLEELIKEQQTKEAEIQKLEQLLDDIQHSYDNAMREIMINISSGYDDFARSVENNWDSYFSEATIPFGMGEAAKLAVLKSKYSVGGLLDKIHGDKSGRHDPDKMAEDPEFKRITAPIGKEIEAYLQSEGQKMSQNIMASSQSTINRLEADLTHYMSQLEAIDLSGIDLSAFGINAKVNNTDLSQNANLAQVILALLLGGNVDQAFDGLVNGGQSWGTFIKNFITTEFVEILIANIINILIGPVGWVYLIARSVWGLWRAGANADSMGKKVLMGSKMDVVNAIKEQRDSEIYKMQQKFNGSIHKNSETVSNGFKASLNQQKDALDKLIQNKQTNEAHNTQELARLNGLKQELLGAFNTLAELIQGEQYDEDGVIACGVKMGS